jgi:Uma2 family endonuclease
MVARVLMPIRTGKRMTAEELFWLPKDEMRYELVQGELQKMTPASVRHGRITMRLGSMLEQHARKHNLGAVYAAETGFKISEEPETVRAADVAFVAEERIPPGGEPDGYWAIAPDLVVEVVSATDSAAYLQSKVSDWLNAGVRLMWVVYPDTKSVVVHYPSGKAETLKGSDTLDGGDVIPGFACRVEEIFA